MRRPVSPVAPLSAWPLPLAEFWNDLRVVRWVPVLTGDGIENTTEGGEVIVAQRGPRLWRWSVTVAPMYGADAAILAGRLEELATGVGSFMATPPFNSAPQADPGARFLGAATPTIASLPAGGRTCTIGGLPGSYRLTAGDFIAVTRDTPARFELHRLVTGGVANAAGLSPVLQVTPAFRPGVVVGAAVTLRNPAMRAVIVPGSLRPAEITPGVANGFSFDAMQTLRKAG